MKNPELNWYGIAFYWQAVWRRAEGRISTNEDSSPGWQKENDKVCHFQNIVKLENDLFFFISFCHEVNFAVLKSYSITEFHGLSARKMDFSPAIYKF